MTEDEAIKKAILHEIGKPVEPGTYVACWAYPYTMQVVRHEGDKVICLDKDEKEMAVPSKDIFDAKKVKKIAQIIFTFGFYNPESPPLIVNL